MVVGRGITRAVPVHIVQHVDNAGVDVILQLVTGVTCLLEVGQHEHPVDRPDIILNPHESKTVSIQFTKFFDDSDPVTEMSFPNIRVMSKYTAEGASQEVIEDEINNAIAKLGMSVGL